MKLSEELTRVLCTYDDDALNWYRHEHGQALDFVQMSTKLVPTDIVEGREQRVHKMPPHQLGGRRGVGHIKVLPMQW